MKFSTGLIPIDTLILKHMTEEGTELAEMIPLGPSVKALAKRIDGITSTQISGRIQTLERIGLCVPIPLLPASQGRGWQRTPKGDALLADAEKNGVMKAIGDFNATINEDRPKDDKHGSTILVRQAEIEPEDLDWENAEVHKGSPGGEEA